MKFLKLYTVGLLLAAIIKAGSVAPVMAAEPGPLTGEEDFLSLYFDEDQLVEVATRAPKPISQVAENVTIISSKEIEAMRADSVAEILRQVAGVHPAFKGHEVGDNANLYIQGSDYEHVTLLLDGVRWTYAGTDYTAPHQIPVQIIDRIEVIKGAASSAWGSALGGVINIITKEAGTREERPDISLTATAGEFGVRKLAVDAAGQTGSNLGYYLYSGGRESDGIKDDRFYDDRSLYGKLRLTLPRQWQLTATAGYMESDGIYLHVNAWDLFAAWKERSLLYTATVDGNLTDNLFLSVSCQAFDNTPTDTGHALSTGAVTDQKTYAGLTRSAKARLVWQQEHHTVVLGTEIDRRESTDIDDFANYQAATLFEEIQAFYLNDTWRMGRLTLTPGIRHDRLSIAESITSPSLGATFRYSDKTLLRANAARGFRKPNLTLKYGDPAIFGVNNPALEAEKIWTYQAGLETTALKYLWLKSTLFLHEATAAWQQDPALGWAWANKDTERRKGLELEARTTPWHDFSLGGNYTHLYQKDVDDNNDALYFLNLFVDYNDQERTRAQLAGHYVWYGTIWSPEANNGRYHNFLWDLTLARRVADRPHSRVEIFCKAHNLFNSNQYPNEAFLSSPRWLEAGIRVNFH